MKLNPPIYILPLAFVVGALFVAQITGCATKGGGSWSPEDCAKAQAVYEAYKVSLAFREPSKEEVIAARIAALFLASKCGWTDLTAASRGEPAGGDENGVPIVVPPQ